LSGLRCLSAGTAKLWRHGIQFVPFTPPFQVYLQQCGEFAGWWTPGYFCADVND